MKNDRARSHVRVLLCIALLAASGCEYLSMEVVDPKLRVSNQSDDTLLVLANTHYPDTSISNTIPFQVEPGDTTGLSIVNDDWENIVDSTGAVTLFFVDYQEKRLRGDSRENYQVLERRIISKVELDSLDWLVSYP